MKDEKHSQIGERQVIRGTGHQVAGHDIHNHTQVGEYEPPSDSPHLQKCKACGWHGVAVNASECRKCGYSYALEHAVATERKRQEGERFVNGLLIVAFTVAAVALFVSYHTSLSFLEAIVVCGFGAVVAWGAWTWLAAWCSVKFKRHRKE